MLSGMRDPELVAHVASSTGLRPGEAARLVGDVLSWYAESTEDFVRRRHDELQSRGMKNPEIFRCVSSELAERVVAPPALTERQLRRIVYG
jgi:hypothetical protein